LLGDVRSIRLEQANDIEFYRPWSQRSNQFLAVTVKTAFKPEAATSTVRNALAKIDPALADHSTSDDESNHRPVVRQRRLTMTLLAFSLE